MKPVLFLAFFLTVGICAADQSGSLKIGWGQANITPERPVLLVGSSPRISEGVLDPVTATVLVIESTRGTEPVRMAIISADLCEISKHLINSVRSRLKQVLPEMDPKAVFIGATHTHASANTYPQQRDYFQRYLDNAEPADQPYGVDLPIMTAAEYVAFASERIADAVVEAWKGREPGGIAYGQGNAVVGRNRLRTFFDGKSQMLGNSARADFSHVEGYEDHAVNILATFSTDGREMLTGMIVNIAAPSQVMRGYLISADFWHEAREKLRQRLGENLYILPQLSAAGDQNWMPPVERALYERMLRLTERISVEELAERIAPSSGRGLSKKERVEQVSDALNRVLAQPRWRADSSLAGTPVRSIADEVNRFLTRDELAERIADAVSLTLPLIEKEIDWNPVCAHKVETVGLPYMMITEEYVQEWEKKSEKAAERYRELLAQLEQNPQMREQHLWYRNIARAYLNSLKGDQVRQRFAGQQRNPELPVELHAARIGDVGFATNPFELYLDFGMRIKGRSPAMQTFLVQLAGPGSYLPSARAVDGGAYGATPGQCLVGPEGGQKLADWSVSALQELWRKE